MKKLTESEQRYSMSHVEIEQSNHRKVCALLRRHGLSSADLTPFEAQMKLAKRIACLVRESRKVR